MIDNTKDTMNSMTQTTHTQPSNKQTVIQDHDANQPQVPRSLRQSVEQSLTQYFNE